MSNLEILAFRSSMPLKKIALFTFAVVALTGCSSYYDGRPSVANYEVSPEAKLKSAKHWRIVADDVASNIQRSINTKDLKFFVPRPDEPSSSFSRVFSAQLRSSLHEKGMTVSATSANALKISVNVETVKHVTLPKYMPGTITMLASGVAVLRNAVVHDSPNLLGAAIVGTDATISAMQSSERPSTEVVLTTSIEQNGVFILHTTDTYYVDGVDSCLFKPITAMRDYTPLGTWSTTPTCN